MTTAQKRYRDETIHLIPDLLSRGILEALVEANQTSSADRTRSFSDHPAHIPVHTG